MLVAMRHEEALDPLAARDRRVRLLKTLIHRRFVSLKLGSDQSPTVRSLRRLSTRLVHPSRMIRFLRMKPNDDMRASIVRAWVCVSPESMAEPPGLTWRITSGARS